MKFFVSEIRKPICALAFTLSIVAGEATVIIGGDILNGNFNAGSSDGDTTDDNFEATPDWLNSGGALTMQATRTNLASPDGTRNAVLSLTGDRIFGSELGLNGYIISAGDTFDVQYEWRDAFNWNDNLDRVEVTLFTTDDDTFTGAVTELVSDFSELSTANNTYQTVDHDAFYTATSGDAGKRLFLYFKGATGEGSDNNGFARFDNLTLEVTSAVPEPSSAFLIGLAGLCLMRRRR
ncbi:PEP-CTERM sorting domain-containing protein [bacterium]|nr:PEP-CTERM sorting domain-containing protein [bacterium]MDA7508762.1 PEP-CTERM sorting domain-containing protein [Akkermansiaceae bacterium]MDA7521936.1 PEP-CTERM sorting domain-containing protein [Akkermansiaceae bacterium]MDA7523422.1 PEP-CTERM sorting domain-containing protein [bacterium]MDA7630905.1 PEP-CTERM sorting domain-containing protein [Akkermansiaceae bacterium]